MDNAFQRWVDLARPRTQLWRTILGGVIVVAVWMTWTTLVLIVSMQTGLTTPDRFLAMFGGESIPLSHFDAAMTLGVAMATFWGLWFGVLVAVKFVHQRAFTTVLAHDRSFSGGQFLIGCGLAIGYLAVGAVSNLVTGATPVRSDLPLESWLLAFLPLAILIGFQSAGEEVFFRGYLMQQLAAKIPHPIVWGLLPSIGFGLLHISNGGDDPQFAMYYVIAASMLGLVMAALVWRTGGLAAAIGFHIANNLGALLLVGVAGATPPISLFVLAYRDMLGAAPVDLLILGLMLAFVLSPFAPLPKGQPLRR